MEENNIPPKAMDDDWGVRIRVEEYDPSKHRLKVIRVGYTSGEGKDYLDKNRVMQMSDGTDKIIERWRRPDHPPEFFKTLIKNAIGMEGYITKVGTVRILGPIHEDPEISKYASSSKIKGPTSTLTAKGSLWG